MKQRLTLLILSLLPSGYYFYLNHKESLFIDNYIEFHHLENLPITRESAIEISDHFRDIFNIEESTFRHLDMSKRPFLRNTTTELLNYKEGLCGEGTRVLVNILLKLGYDATRISLYNKYLHSSHTLVSIVLDGDEHLIDSINSSPEVNNFLRRNTVSSSDFQVARYIGNLKERKTKLSSLRNSTTNIPLEKYLVYSYEALPYNKLLSKLGFEVRAFNLQRPHKIISSISEKPHLTLAIFYTVLPILTIFAFISIHLYKLLPLKRPSNPKSDYN